MHACMWLAEGNDQLCQRKGEMLHVLTYCHALVAMKAHTHVTWVYPFTGLDYWTGILDWNTGLTFESKFNHKN